MSFGLVLRSVPNFVINLNLKIKPKMKTIKFLKKDLNYLPVIAVIVIFTMMIINGCS
jgi:hypothetical protein